jgi:FKBP-type peptidyl-prolyl cis-trans isomerase FkpA
LERYLKQNGKMIKNTMRKKISAAAFLALAVIIVSCNPAKKYEEEEKSLIADYIAKNNITVAPDSHGLYYIEMIPGSGELIQTGDSVGVYYTGYFLSGIEFDSNVGDDIPFRFRVGSYYLIEGWSIGLPYMKLGTKSKFLMPSSIAYGTSGYGYYDAYGYYITKIPGYTPILFEIEVVELVRKGGR